ncbi:RIP metalloprotease RseP [Lactovum miscens]|uniref:Zinc metalloprotease n=1 Tax=Lactovum miscens TaxID=190387 RepID=A0A841C858_9LACT|nr:RIP metalloprotease RseP [Lactovum miscens]MBB5888675.1 regulator of sigma E protease [Lactovum miscens]
MQQLIINIIVFIIIFGVIVAIHEYGHLFWAKRAGILVREYAIGMGPKIFAHRAKDGTLYTIRILPVGGYVRMAGWGDDTTEIKKGTPASLVVEDELVQRVNLSGKIELENALPIFVTEYDFDKELTISGESSGVSKTFKLSHDATIIEEDGTELRIAPIDVQYQSASILGKILTNFGGPLNNFILGLIAFIVLVFLQGGVPSNSTIVGTTPKDMPAYQAGLRQGDKILDVNGKNVGNWTELVTEISTVKADEIDLRFQRGNQTKVLEIVPEMKNGSMIIGITESLNTGILDKIVGGFTQTWSAMTLIGRALGNLITHPSLNKLGGPVAIFQQTGQAAQAGLAGVISFLALLSINLGIVNLIPIPALDGGKILINLIEAIRRKPLKPEHEQFVTLVGVIFMIALMLAVTWNDIMRFFTR